MDPLARHFDLFRTQGDLQALAAVFDALAPRLLPVAMHLCGHPADAEDALQQTFVLAMDRAASFDATQRLEPWLAGLLHNVARNQNRRARHRRAEPLAAVAEPASDAPGPLAAAERDELVARLRTHVDALPADQRQVLRLQLQHGLSPAQIAEALELPPGTVRMRLHRGLAALRRFLPASLSALLFASLPSRGLAAVQQAVLTTARQRFTEAAAATTTGSTVLLGGVLVTKKLAAACLFVLALGVWLWSTSGPTEPPPGSGPRSAAMVTAVASTPEAEAPARAEALVHERTSVADGRTGNPRPFPDGAEWFVVRVVDRSTGAGVAGATVHWHAERDLEAHRIAGSPTNLEAYVQTRTIEGCAELFGWRTTTDDTGAAKVARLGKTRIAAAHGDSYGTMFLGEHERPPANGFVLALGPDQVLRVRVVDDRREPVPAMPILLAEYGDRGNVVSVREWACAITGPDGIAAVPHVQDMTEEATTRATTTWGAFAMVPGQRTAMAMVSLAPPPAEPVEIVLPPCGRVCVRIEIAGVPYGDVRQFVLGSPTDTEAPFDGFRAMVRPDADGWARFPHVPLQQHFGVQAKAPGGSWTAFAGPVARDQEVRVVLGPKAEEALLRGRLRLDGGEPARNRKIEMRALGIDSTLERENEFRTDGDGRFVVSLGEPSSDSPPVAAFCFDLWRDGTPPLRAHAPGRAMQPGILDLGDLELREDPALCRGRFLHGDRSPTGSVPFWIEEWRVGEDGDADWTNRDDVMLHQDGDGQFAVYGEMRPGRYRLQVDPEVSLASAIAFAAGATDLVVTIDRPHALTATVLVPAATPAGAVRAHLVPVVPEPRDTDDERFQRHTARPFAMLANGEIRHEGEVRRRLEWPRLRPGVYTLEFVLDAANAVVATIPEIRVPMPAVGDPRLEGIDLRPHVRAVTTRLFDASGLPVTGPTGVATAANATGERWAVPLRESATVLLVPAGPVELTFFVDGFRPTTVRCDGAPLDVRLEEWPTVDVTFADLPPLPPGWLLAAWLRAVEPETVHCRAFESEGHVLLPGAPSEVPVPVTGNRANLPIGDGRFEVVLRIWDRAGSGADVLGVAAGPILTTTRMATVTIPAESWRNALLEIGARTGSSSSGR